jgi:hypothetical protein
MAYISKVHAHTFISFIKEPNTQDASPLPYLLRRSSGWPPHQQPKRDERKQPTLRSSPLT